MGRKQRTARSEWFCTDEVCKWFGGNIFSKTTRRKLTISNVADVGSNVVKSWKPGMLGRALRRVVEADPMTWKSKEGSWYIPDVRAPSRTAAYKGKTITKSKPTYKADCKKEKAKGNTPLGFITSIAPTRSEHKKQVQDEDASSFGLKTPFGGIGHAVGVSCRGEVVADTAPGYHKGKKIRKNNIVFIQGPSASRWTSDTGAPLGFLSSVYDLFNKPALVPSGLPLRASLLDWRGRGR